MRDFDPQRWVRDVVSRAQDANIDTLVFDLYYGGYAVFQGAVAPKDPRIGDADLLALLDHELHSRGMRFMLMHLGAHSANWAVTEFPTWRVRQPDGSDVPAFASYRVCLNTPFANMLMQEFAEVLARYRIDGMYIEGLYGQVCYCDYCKAEFVQRFGQPIPVYETSGAIPAAAYFRSAQGLTSEHRRFVADIQTNFIRRVRQVMDDVSPSTVFVPCPTMSQDVYADYRAWAPYADAIALERQWGFLRWKPPLLEIGLSMQVMQAESGRPVVGTTWSAWHVDHDYTASTPQHYRLNFAELLLYGGTPQVHVQTLWDVETTGLPIVREMYNFEERIAPFLHDAALVAHVGLVLDWTDFKPSDHLLGYYQVLAERHIPFKLIAKHSLGTVTTEEVAVLLLPNVERMSDEDVANVKRFIHDGGGLVLTYRTGARHEDGSLRAEWPFRDVTGVSGPFGIVTTPAIEAPTPGHGYDIPSLTYYRVRDDSAIDVGSGLQSFRGSYVECQPTSGHTLIEAIDYDYSKMRRQHPVLGWYPGRPLAPLVIANEAGGRCVFFAAEFDKAVVTSGLPGLFTALADAVVWASGSRTSPVEITASPTLEAATHYSATQSTFTILLVNHSMNQLHPNFVVRHVEPLRDIKIRVLAPAGPDAAVRSAAGADLSWTHDGTAYLIRLDQLREHDAIVVGTSGLGGEWRPGR